MTAENALSAAQHELFEIISYISEDKHCASWLSDIEYDIWDALKTGDTRYGSGKLRLCKLLSEEIGGWIFWADENSVPSLPREQWGPTFAPMAQWLAMVHKKKQALCGIAPLPKRGGVVTNALIDRLRDEEGI